MIRIPLRPAPNYRRPRTEGYTMMEVLIVLVLAGILLAMAAPRIDISHFQTDSGMRSVGTLLLATQRLAVKRQHDVIMAFDVEEDLIRIHEDANNNGLIDTDETVRAEPLENGVVFGRGGAPRPGFLPGGGDITFEGRQDGMPSLTFHRGGSTSEEGGFYLTSWRALRSDEHATDTRVLHVERSTGRPSWYRYTTDGWRRGF